MLGKSSRLLGISPPGVDRRPAAVQDAPTPNTARGIGSGRTGEPPKESSRARPEEERREPGEAPEASSGRTKTTLVPSGNSRSAAGTEVSRPEGFGTAQGPIRSRSDEAPAGPGPHPVAPPPTGDGGRRVWDGNGVSGTPGPSGAVGRRKERRCRIPSGISGRVGLGFGDRRVARRSGQGVAPRGNTPSPERLTGRAGGWKWDEDWLRGVDRFTGRLLGANFLFQPPAPTCPAQGTYSPMTASTVSDTMPSAEMAGTRCRSRPRSAMTARATTIGNALRA